MEDYHQQISTYHTEPKLDALAKQAMDEINIQNYYQTVDDLSLKWQNTVADILRNISFDTTDNQKIPDIMLTIQHYQAKVGNIGKEAPINFLTDKELDELYTPKRKSKVSLYKALLFFHTTDALKAGIISLKLAYRFLSLENYLHRKAHWLANKNRLLEEAGFLAFADIDELLGALKKQLKAGYHKTNGNIKSGKNAHIKFDAKGRMVLATPKVEKLNTHSVSALFAEQKYTSILKILSDIQPLTIYLDCLRHHHVKDKKVLPITSILYAAILGIG